MHSSALLCSAKLSYTYIYKNTLKEFSCARAFLTRGQAAEKEGPDAREGGVFPAKIRPGGHSEGAGHAGGRDHHRERPQADICHRRQGCESGGELLGLFY